MIVGVKQHDILTHRIDRSVQLFWAPLLTQNLVLVFAQINMKECGMLMTKMSCFRSTLPLVNSKALQTLQLSSFYNSCLRLLCLNTIGGLSRLVVRGRHVGGVISSGRHDRKSLPRVSLTEKKKVLVIFVT